MEVPKIKIYVGATGYWTNCEVFDCKGSGELNDMLEEALRDYQPIDNHTQGFKLVRLCVENAGDGSPDDYGYFDFESIEDL